MSVETHHIGDATLYLGDCREIMPGLSAIDATIADPPYQTTNLHWDRRCDGWLDLVPSNVLWCFGSMAFFLQHSFAGWKYSQEIIWEKHNGSNFHADRFRRVHEIAIMVYRGAWTDVYKLVPVTNDATARTIRRAATPGHHLGARQASNYVSHDGGPRKQRSVIYARSCHGYAQHPTQKPTAIIEPLCQYSCPPGGTVLDPFMGSGTTGIVCRNQGQKFIGIELNREYFDIACRRIEAAHAQGHLF